MSKMTKTQLKSIVKECLVEILAEGLGGNASETKKKNLVKRRKQEEKRLREHRQKFEVKVDNTVSQITTDPVMQSILQDTARTTLQEQMSSEAPGTAGSSHMPGAPNSAGVNLDNIFDGPSQNWGKLAFDD